MANLTPSPNNYQSALHGLLTNAKLGSTLHNLVVDDQNVETSTTHDMWHPESPFQLELLPSPTRNTNGLNSCAVSADPVEQHPFGHIMRTARTSRDFGSNNTPIAAIEDLVCPEQPGRAQVEDDLTMLKIYRYQVAPWVSKS
jgi:hypothetical protein